MARILLRDDRNSRTRSHWRKDTRDSPVSLETTKDRAQVRKRGMNRGHDKTSKRKERAGTGSLLWTRAVNLLKRERLKKNRCMYVPKVANNDESPATTK